MCGIAGWLGFLPEPEQIAASMAYGLRHRGPDAHDTRSWPDASLVHTRLSIIDLSPTGAQPMCNEDGTIWVIFNGEIYNHAYLRRRLETHGHFFRGRSDTEVLPHLYEEMGLEFVTELRGMFALALYDTRRHTLVLARDRFGIKPLFYAPTRSHLAFASEVQALLNVPGIDLRPDPQAIYDFAALFSIPAPETFYTGIRALQPGEQLVAQMGDPVTWSVRPYHHWTVAPDLALTPEDASDRASSLILNAVRSQLESDVPLGAFLSGGIDSSLISSAAQSLVSDGIRTFNVRFSEKEYDETWAAVTVAQYIQSRHMTLDMNQADDEWEHISQLLIHTGQPFADTSIFATHAICRLMRQHVTVALSGDGGDEGFGGYNLYRRIPTLARLQKLPTPVWRRFWHELSRIVILADSLGVAVHPQLSRRSLLLSRSPEDATLIGALFRSVSDDELDRLCQPRGVEPVCRLFEPQWEYRFPAGISLYERLLAHATEVNTRLVLANDFLFKVDAASMKESLEVRVPMLDEDLFTFGLSLPYKLKVRRNEPKAVLRSVAERRLPAAIAHKPKHGFGVPVDRWVGPSFKARLRETLLDSRTQLDEYFRPETYRQWIESFCAGTHHPGLSRSDTYQRVMMLLATHLALGRSTSFGVQNSTVEKSLL